MRISDWSSDVCSSDLTAFLHLQVHLAEHLLVGLQPEIVDRDADLGVGHAAAEALLGLRRGGADGAGTGCGAPHAAAAGGEADRHERGDRSDEHPSELQSLMRNSYAVFCLQTIKLHSHKYETH